MDTDTRNAINKKVRMYHDPNAEVEEITRFYPYYPTCKIMPWDLNPDIEKQVYYSKYDYDQEVDFPEGIEPISAGEHFWRFLPRAMSGAGVMDDIPFKIFRKIGFDGEDLERCFEERRVPPKDALFAIIVSNKLSLSFLERLLETGGLRLEWSSKRDWVVKECLRRGIYTLNDINTIMADNGELPISFSWSE